MNYFLHYDNSAPLFVGGCWHGRRDRYVPDGSRFLEVVEPRPVPSFRDVEKGIYSSVKTQLYRERWFVADGRRFRLMVHEVLTDSAALMLMMSTVGEHPDLVKRVQELEAENRALKRLLREVVG